jgi:hypothetical protein
LSLKGSQPWYLKATDEQDLSGRIFAQILAK